MPRIIGVVGLIDSGKTTIGSYLTEHHGFKSDSFAAPLKDMLSSIFGWDRTLLEGNTTESRLWRNLPDEWWERELKWENKFREFPRFTPRACLQLFGTDIFRNRFHPDIWLLSLKNRLNSYKHQTVITDCRFPNECKLIVELGGEIIRVKRGPDPSWVQFIQAKIGTKDWFADCEKYALESGIHSSEWLSFGYKEHHCIINDKSLVELYSAVDTLLGL